MGYQKQESKISKMKNNVILQQLFSSYKVEYYNLTKYL